MHLLTHTAGDHCESCAFAYYRPSGVSPNDSTPCVPCDCDVRGITDNGDCVKVHYILYTTLVVNCYFSKYLAKHLNFIE